VELIKLSGINKYFGSGENRVHVLKDISLTIEKGDFVAIIGQSGSGKSTLMNILGCLDTPTTGSYRINGTEAGRLGADQLAGLRSKTFGFIFQRYNLLSSLSAVDNVALPAVYRGMRQQERTNRAKELLRELGLGDKFPNKPNELSGGQQQRVSIARALMNGGEIILADEPTGALDSKSGEMVMEIITELHAKGHTIILVTHDKTIASYASRTIEIKDGDIVSDTRSREDIATAGRPQTEQKKSAFGYLKDRVSEAFRMSVQAIFSHKLRSLLTMLGIIIGIASVVSVVALGRGGQAQIMANISSIGTNTIDIYPGSSWGDMRSNRVRTLTVSDSDLLAQQSYIDSATPNVSTSGTVVYGNESVSASVSGAGEQFFDVRGVELVQGRLYTADDVMGIASVAVIDENTKNRLFPDSNPIGQVLIFSKKPLEVIGVAKRAGTMGNNDSLTIWVPYTTVMSKITGAKHINSITVKIADDVNSQMAEGNLTQLLLAKHGSQDFFTSNSDTIMQTVESATGTMTLLISGIALISLIVGGIGVMNIMLVSVTERTKEIGIRMAIGARQANIMEQFLIEAVLICILGGAVGVGISALIGWGFNSMPMEFKMLFSSESIALAIGCSTAIGVIFGFMPARGASKLNPIDALARE
jgi:macrolide transport system ATP-binding/permease protein